MSVFQNRNSLENADDTFNASYIFCYQRTQSLEYLIIVVVFFCFHAYHYYCSKHTIFLSGC